jgi:hypothetical protein
MGTFNDDELVELVAKHACLGYKKHALKKVVEDELGMPINMGVFEMLRKKAREYLKDTMLSPADHQVNAIEMLYQVAQKTPMHNVKVRCAEILMGVTQLVKPEENEDRVKKIQAILAGIEESVADADPTVD